MLGGSAPVGAHGDPTGRVTLSADQGYDAQDCAAELREVNVTPHVAQNINGRRSAVDVRTTHHPGCAVSLRIRRQIKGAFSWAEIVAGLRKAAHRGLPKIAGSSPSRWPATVLSVCQSG